MSIENLIPEEGWDRLKINFDNKVTPMDNLLEAINEHYHSEGEYPTVKVRPKFCFEDSVYKQLAKLIWNDGIDVRIDDTLNEDWRLV